MNHATDCLYITIKNNQAHINRLLQGMFIVARRTLGYNPRASSYPFTTAARYAEHGGFKTEQAFYAKENAIELNEADHPHKNTQGRNNDAHRTFVTMQKTHETNKNGFIAQLLAEQHDDFDKSQVCTNTLAKNLFDDYFADLVEFARHNRYFAPNWR